MLTVLALSLATTTGMVVLMPVEGTDVLPAVRTTANDMVRASALARLGTSLQSAADTDAVVADAVAAGLNCSLRDIACGVRVGAIAGAAEVLIPVVQTGRAGALEITIKRLDVARERAVAQGVAVLTPGDGQRLEAFLATLLDPPATLDVDVEGAVPGAVVIIDELPVGRLPLAAPVAVVVGPHRVTVVDPGGAVLHERDLAASPGYQRVSFTAALAPPPVSAISDPAATPSPLIIAGIVTTGIGGLAAIAGGALAAVTEVGLAEPRPGAGGYTDDRDFGRLMVGTAIVGVVVAVGGAALVLVGGGS